MRTGAREAILPTGFAFFATLLVALAIVTAPSPPPRAPSTPEEIARAIDEKERSREQADLLRRLDAAAAVAGVGIALTGAGLAARVAGRPRPRRRLLALGGVVALTGPVLAWTAYWMLAARQPLGTPWWTWLPLGGALLSTLGFVLAGSGLRPAGSERRGAALGLAIYSCAGLLWLFGYHALVGGNATGAARAIADPVAFYVLVLLWPLQAAASFGLFGLTFGS